MDKIRILLADDHMIVRMGISALFTTAKDIEVVGEAKNGNLAVKLADALRPDVVIMDLMMPELSGSEATKLIHDAHPDMKIVILTTFGTSMELAKAVNNGAVGVLLKDEVGPNLISALRLIAAGQKVIPPQLFAQIERDNTLQSLTEHQLEILASVAQGQSNADIAKQFGVSEITIKKTLSKIFDRIGVANRSEAVALALRKQLLRT